MAITEKYVRFDAAGLGTASGDNDTTNATTGALSWAEMLTDVTAGPVRYNVKYNASAYARTTATDAFTTAGTTALPRYIRGFNSTIGDLEANGRTRGGTLVTTNFPQVTYTTGKVTFNSYFVVSCMDISGAIAGTTVTGGIFNVIRRCKISNTHASSASANAVNMSTTGGTLDDCDCYLSSSSSSAFAVQSLSTQISRCLIDCNSAGGGAIAATDRGCVDFCTIRNFALGISSTGNLCSIKNTSFRNGTGAHLNNASTTIIAEDCVAWGSGGGSSKWYNSTTTVRGMFLNNNAVGNMANADTNAGDWPFLNAVALTADPFTSSTDMTLNSNASGGTLCKGVGILTYLDLGAWQVQATGAAAVGPGFGRGVGRGF